MFQDVVEYERYDNIADGVLDLYKKTYSNDITKEDIFYYVYGILHSKDYRQKYNNDLKKDIPRIPLVEDFWTFCNAGKQLADLHLNYEIIEPYPLNLITKEASQDISYIVQKMKFGKDNDKKTDKSKIIYNNQITIQDIPLKAYEYIVNGRSPVEWIIDQYQYKVDKASGLDNNPNEYSESSQYIIKLIGSVVNMSLKTLEIIESLPALKVK
ncbi:type ISP restriction/modification enzyme [Bacillus sp. FJAT-45066]|uniref:type ISP restriction/modification enzyme n=1 Tax=Bacillus sp. FJAT-45066 TaxID=2011010 RepID=UPI000BB7794D|nr:type ISP restriction/modification enzyme [Bacillus sp. FJAT-45066]